MTRSGRSRLLGPLVLLLAGAALCGLLLQILAPDHDNAFHLEIAARMLAGGRYFVDFMELNPPLYPVLMIPVHGLRALTGLDLYSGFIIWISAAIIASSIAVWTELPASLDEAPVGRTVIALSVEAVLFLAPGMEFGQRDHLAIVLILPFLPWLAARRHGQPMTVAALVITAAAGIGLLIKPFLLFVVALPYAVRLLEERDWRVLVEPPVWLLAIVAGLYAGLIVILFPEWLQVARIARVAYAAYDATAWIGRRTVLTAAVIVVLAIANEVLGQTNPRERRLGRMLAAAAMGALASYVLQHKDIGYQFIPASILLGLLAGMVALVSAQWVAAAPLPGWLRVWVSVVCRHRAIAVCLIAMIPLSRNVDRAMIDSRRMDASMRSLAALLNANHIGPRVAVFGASAYPAYPLSLYRETLPAWRFPQPWVVPWIVQQYAAGRGGAPQTVQIEAELRTLVRDDFRRFRPDGIVVDESHNQIALPSGFDMMAWFRKDPEMAAILDGYERVALFKDPDDRRWAFTSLALYRRRAGQGS
jgi:hypothetical protein